MFLVYRGCYHYRYLHYWAFYYELTTDGASYYLLVPGPDDKPFTNDDILPSISNQEPGKIGYRVKTSEAKQ